MIIRRRTYSRKKEYSYGYFMLNIPYNNNPSIELNIYTSCMQEEAPVGYFPKSYRETDVDGSGAKRAVGVTDGNTIVVWTTNRCFKSTNGGVTWTLLGTFSAGSGRWYWNIVTYMDTTAYYMSGCYQENGYRYLIVYKYTIATGAITKHIIKSISLSTKWSSCPSSSSAYNWDVSGTSTYCNRVTSPNMISNNGLYIVWEFADLYGHCSSDYHCYMMVDMPHLTYSAPWYAEAQGSAYYAVNGHLGSHIKDSSSYGYMLLVSRASYTGDTINGNIRIYNLVFHKVINNPVTYNGKSMSVSDITTTIKNKFNTQILKVVNKNPTSNRGMSWLFCTNNINYYNLMVVSITLIDTLILTCDLNFNNIVEMGWKSASSGYTTSDGTIASHCITPDNKYYINMTTIDNLVYNLSSKTFKESYKFRDLEPTLTSDLYSGQDLGYMLPKTTFWS